MAYGEELESRAGLLWARSSLAHLAIRRDNLSQAEMVLAAAEEDLSASGVMLGRS